MSPRRAAPRRRWWVGVAIAPVALAALAALVYGYLVGYRVALHPGDRELCVTVDDLHPLPGGAVKLPAHEKLERLFHTDGSWEVTYEYDATGEAHPLYLSSGVSESTSDRDTRNEFLGRQTAVGLGSLVTGTKLDETPRDDLLRWGTSRAPRCSR